MDIDDAAPENGVSTASGTSDAPSDQVSDPNAPRLAIQSLRLENFKSYGGVVNVGPFHKRFSSIVGPNGSGKSNVIDAMLFVFGRRAKQLRHSKVRELLHHSDTYPDVSSATVVVNFHEIIDTGDGDDDFDVVPGSQFSVARRAFRNDTSKYYLNDKEVKMSAVIELLKSKGVDLDNNRFLILQGEVEQISMMKPKAPTAHEDGLLEYLEDIIGSNRHLEAIQQSANEVEVMNEERSHKLNRVKAAERERDNLEESKNEAELFMDKERDLFTKQIELNQAALHETVSQLAAHEEENRLSEAALEESKKSREALETEVRDLHDTFDSKKREADTLAEQLNAAKDEFNATERIDIQLGADLKALKAREKRLLATVAREEKRAEESRSEAEKHAVDETNAQNQGQELETTLNDASANLERIHAKLRKETEPLRRELEQKQTDLLPFKDTVNQRQREADLAKSELSLHRENLDTPKRELEEVKQRIETLEAGRDQGERSRAELADEQNRIATEEVELRRRSAHLQDSLKKASSKVMRLRTQLEETKSAAANRASESKLLCALKDASQSGLLHGIVGRLGDLGSIDEQYSVAAGAAAGSRLENIVVEKASQAEACIRFMRERNLGRTTFIILEKIVNLVPQMNAPGKRFDGPRLFDLVRTRDERVLVAFYFALRDTLYATSLEQARRMAFKPTRTNRVVTLGGELIEATGAMTGGGSGPPRYRMRSKSASGTIDSSADASAIPGLESTLEAAQREVRELEARIADDDAKLKEAERRSEVIDTELRKLARDYQSNKTTLDEIYSTTLPQLKANAAHVERVLANPDSSEHKQLRRLEATLKARERALEEAHDACSELDQAISDLQERIVDAGGPALKQAKQHVEQAQDAITSNATNLASARTRRLASEKTGKAADTAAQNAKDGLGKIDEERQGLKEKRRELEDKAEEVNSKYKQLEERHDAYVAEVKELAETHTSKKKELLRERQREAPLVDRAQEARRRMSAAHHEINSLKKRVRGFERKLRDSARAASEAMLGNAVPDMDEAEATDVDASCNVARDASREEGSMDAEEATTRSEENDPAAMGTNSDDVAATHSLTRDEREKLQIAITVLEGELAELKPNLGAISEYHRKEAEYQSQVKDLDSITSRRDDARRRNDSLRKARLDEFMQGFSTITMKLKELYQMITLGGDAELELVDSLDPFSEGIVFSVRPPKKSWKNISNLSGGEKTLSSLALVFALHYFKPTPLYFLDEIDAALDFKNVSIVANYVKERTKNAQFIIISLRNNMFELADRLVGIYKTHNTTKSVTINPKAIAMPHATSALRPGEATQG